jgi:hypothetical protein
MDKDILWVNIKKYFTLLEDVDGNLKDRLGDQRGGSEWEPIKILREGRTRAMPQIHNQGFPYEFAKVA